MTKRMLSFFSRLSTGWLTVLCLSVPFCEAGESNNASWYDVATQEVRVSYRTANQKVRQLWGKTTINVNHKEENGEMALGVSRFEISSDSITCEIGKDTEGNRRITITPRGGNQWPEAWFILSAQPFGIEKTVRSDYDDVDLAAIGCDCMFIRRVRTLGNDRRILISGIASTNAVDKWVELDRQVWSWISKGGSGKVDNDVDTHEPARPPTPDGR